MPQFRLTLQSLHELDSGKPAAAFNHALQTIMNDIAERRTDKAKRKVTFTVEATPILDRDTGRLKGASVQCRFNTHIPIRQTDVYPMTMDAENGVYFQSLSPKDPFQADLPMQLAPPVAVDDDGDDDQPDVQKI